MVDFAFDRIERDPQRQQRRVDRAEYLRERDVKVAQPGLRCLLAAVLLLRLGRQIVLQVPHLMRKRAMLRRQQQCRERNLQHASFQDHLVMPNSH